MKQRFSSLWPFQLSTLLNSAVFYSIATLVPLYLTDPIEKGGLGLGLQKGMALYSTFYGISFLTPLLGGALSDSRLKKKGTVLIGNLLYFAALILLLFVKESGLETALILLALGYGFCRVGLAALAGSFAAHFEIETQRVYKQFYLNLCWGFAASTFLGGLLYALASFQTILFFFVGLFALSSLVALFMPCPESASQKAPLFDEHGSSSSNSRLFALLLLTSIPFFVCSVQMATSMTLCLHRDIQRNVGFFPIPAVWINALGSLIITILATLFPWCSKNKTTLEKMKAIAGGLLLSSGAFLLLLLTLLTPLRSSPLSLIVFLCSFCLIALSDFMVRPELLSAATTLVHTKKRGAMTGLLYLVIGGSIKLGGMVAGVGAEQSYCWLFLGLALFALFFSQILRQIIEKSSWILAPIKEEATLSKL